MIPDSPGIPAPNPLFGGWRSGHSGFRQNLIPAICGLPHNPAYQPGIQAALQRPVAGMTPNEGASS